MPAFFCVSVATHYTKPKTELDCKIQKRCLRGSYLLQETVLIILLFLENIMYLDTLSSKQQQNLQNSAFAESFGKLRRDLLKIILLKNVVSSHCISSAGHMLFFSLDFYPFSFPFMSFSWL